MLKIEILEEEKIMHLSPSAFLFYFIVFNGEWHMQFQNFVKQTVLLSSEHKSLEIHPLVQKTLV